jgi:hypothetical protein
MVSWDSGLRATGALDSTAPVLPTHAPTSAIAPTDFARLSLWQRAPMGSSGGGGKRGFQGRLLP